MNVADHLLCEELHKLSGWVGTAFFHILGDDGHEMELGDGWMPQDGGVSPAYDLGYLLRKLPSKCVEHRNSLAGHTGFVEGSWFFGYGDLMHLEGCQCEDGLTPEDAACKLAISLFKQGILKRDE
jgi:hypothetical protein